MPEPEPVCTVIGVLNVLRLSPEGPERSGGAAPTAAGVRDAAVRGLTGAKRCATTHPANRLGLRRFAVRFGRQSACLGPARPRWLSLSLGLGLGLPLRISTPLFSLDLRSCSSRECDRAPAQDTSMRKPAQALG